MKHSAISTLLLLFVICVDICQCSTNTHISQIKRDLKLAKEIGRKLKNLLTWMQEQSNSPETFVGRCAFALKRLRMALTFIVFKMGVIVTTLVFLSVLAFKTLGIGVILLIISSVGLVTKFFTLKQQHKELAQHSPVHVHVHNQDANEIPYHSHRPKWLHRTDDLVPKNALERSAIANLYKRVYFPNNLYDSPSARRIFR